MKKYIVFFENVYYVVTVCDIFVIVYEQFDYNHQFIIGDFFETLFVDVRKNFFNNCLHFEEVEYLQKVTPKLVTKLLLNKISNLKQNEIKSENMQKIEFVKNHLNVN
jgi:hypothetical protein